MPPSRRSRLHIRAYVHTSPCSKALHQFHLSALKSASDHIQPVACAVFYLCLKAYRFYSTGEVTWRTDLSRNPRRFQEIITKYEALLYLRDDDEDHVDTTEVVAEGRGQPASEMNGVVREPNLPEAIHMHQRNTASAVGAGVGLNATIAGFAAPRMESGDV